MWVNELYRHIAQMVLPCFIIMVRSWVLDPLQCVQLTNNFYFKKKKKICRNVGLLWFP